MAQVNVTINGRQYRMGCEDGQEDHVSMGANAATKVRRVVENTEQLLGIELLTAAQALAFRRPYRTSALLEQVIEDFRQKVAFVSRDRVLYPDLQAKKKK